MNTTPLPRVDASRVLYLWCRLLDQLEGDEHAAASIVLTAAVSQRNPDRTRDARATAHRLLSAAGGDLSIALQHSGTSRGAYTPMTDELEAIFGDQFRGFDEDTNTVALGPQPATPSPIVGVFTLADPEPVYVDDLGWYGGRSLNVHTVELVAAAVTADGRLKPIILDSGRLQVLDEDGTTTDVDQVEGFTR